jgi:hypothetical protein
MSFSHLTKDLLRKLPGPRQILVEHLIDIRDRANGNTLTAAASKEYSHPNRAKMLNSVRDSTTTSTSTVRAANPEVRAATANATVPGAATAPAVTASAATKARAGVTGVGSAAKLPRLGGNQHNNRSDAEKQKTPRRRKNPDTSPQKKDPQPKENARGRAKSRGYISQIRRVCV